MTEVTGRLATAIVQVTEEVVGRKVVAMLGDHNAVANTSALVFLLEPEREEAS
jgi:hypothetical protein